MSETNKEQGGLQPQNPYPTTIVYYTWLANRKSRVEGQDVIMLLGIFIRLMLYQSKKSQTQKKVDISNGNMVTKGWKDCQRSGWRQRAEPTL